MRELSLTETVIIHGGSEADARLVLAMGLGVLPSLLIFSKDPFNMYVGTIAILGELIAGLALYSSMNEKDN